MRCISNPPGDFFAGIFPYRIRDFKNNAEFCNISLAGNAELFHIAPVSETTTNQTTNTMTTYTVLFPLYKGSKKYRQIGITQNPAANYKPGVTLRFVDQASRIYVLTGAGLVEATFPR
jgi:hypothetical protein